MIDSHTETRAHNGVCLPKEMERTLRGEVEISGVGIFTGVHSKIRIFPAPAGQGISFQRTDIPGSPLIPAKVEYVQPSSRCTTLGIGNVSVTLVEHLLSALYASGIDNAHIEVDGPEIPGLDGSSLRFCELFGEVGFQEQEAFRRWRVVSEPLSWSRGNVHLIALPSPEYRLSYTLHYPQSPLIRSQYSSFACDFEKYVQEIAPCRTFSLYEEVLPLIERGLIRGGGLENSVVIQGNQVLNPGGLRFPDEMVRHKILDLIGDLSLVGCRLLAHIVAICSGHGANAALSKMLSETLEPRSV